MNKIILSCKQATFYSSIKSFRQIGWIKKLQLKVHFMMCPGCKMFNRQSELIDKGIEYFSTDTPSQPKTSLSDEKKSALKNTVDQSIK